MIPRTKFITRKRLSQLVRDSGSAKYKAWKKAVLERDENRCQFPNCRNTENLQVHHIRRFVDAKHLRYSVWNGVVLCEKCHRIVTGVEQLYEFKFFLITRANQAKQEKKQQDGKKTSGNSGLS